MNTKTRNKQFSSTPYYHVLSYPVTQTRNKYTV